MSNARAIDPAIIRGVSIPELEMSNSRFRNLGRVTFESAIMERYKEIFLIKDHYSYVYLDGIWMQVENVSVLVATVESMERVSGSFPAFLKGRKKTKRAGLASLDILRKRGLLEDRFGYF